MYIDPVSGTLQSLNDTAGTLARMKDATVQNKIRQAELLNRMSKNKAAEEMFNQAQHYGLSSLIAPTTQEWQVAGAFGDSPDPVQLKELNTLSGKAQAGSGDINSYGMQRLSGEGAYIPSESDFVIDKKTGLPVLNKKGAIGKEYADANAQFKKESAVNAKIEADNRKAQAYNESIPQFRQSYTGDEPDQLNQLADDTMAAIKFAERNGDTQGAAAAYNKYVQTGRAIADHYQHQFKPLGSEYFFTAKKGGGGGGNGEKTEDYNIIVNGKKIDITGIPRSVLNSKDQNAALLKLKPDLFKRLGISDPSQFTLERASGQSSGRLDDLEQQKLDEQIYAQKNREKLDNQELVEGATEGTLSFTQKAKIDDYNEAQKKAGSNKRMGYDYSTYYVGDDTRGVAKKNPEDEVQF